MEAAVPGSSGIQNPDGNPKRAGPPVPASSASVQLKQHPSACPAQALSACWARNRATAGGAIRPLSRPRPPAQLQRWAAEAQTGAAGACTPKKKMRSSVCPSLALLTSLALLSPTPPPPPPTCPLDPSPAPRAHYRADVATMSRVYADVNQNMPRSYWDYDSVNIGQSRSSPCLAAFCRPSSLVSRLRRP